MECLELIAFSVTDQCNMNCSFCSREGGEKGADSLPSAIIINALQNARMVFPDVKVVISGGEPLMYEELSSLVRFLSVYQYQWSLNTNGYSLDRDALAFLVGHGLGLVTLSLDGVTAQSHDAARACEGAFEAVMGAMLMLRACSVPFSVNCTLTRQNCSVARKVTEIAHDIGAQGISLSRCQPIGRARDDYRSFIPEDQEFYEVIDESLKFRSDAFDVFVECGFAERFHLLSEKTGRRSRPGKGMSDSLATCNAGRTFLHVAPNGDVYPCAFLDYSIGNIQRENIVDIWQDSAVLNRLRSREGFSGVCGRCKDRHDCGGCRSRAFGVTGNPFESDPFCPRVG